MSKLQKIALEEFQELAGKLEPLLKALGENPANMQARNDIELIFHTIGGSAALAGFHDLSKMGVEVEGLLYKAAPDAPLSQDDIQSVTGGYDSLATFLEQTNVA